MISEHVSVEWKSIDLWGGLTGSYRCLSNYEPSKHDAIEKDPEAFLNKILPKWKIEIEDGSRFPGLKTLHFAKITQPRYPRKGILLAENSTSVFCSDDYGKDFRFLTSISPYIISLSKNLPICKTDIERLESGQCEARISIDALPIEVVENSEDNETLSNFLKILKSSRKKPSICIDLNSKQKVNYTLNPNSTKIKIASCSYQDFLEYYKNFSEMFAFE